MDRLHRLKRKLETELGSEIVSALKDGAVSDIYLNDDGKVWVHRAGEEKKVLTTISTAQADNLIRTVASLSGDIVTADKPVVEAKLPNGERFSGDMPPITDKPTFCIRKPARVVYSLDTYVERGMMTPEQKAAIIQAVNDRRNILIVGGTGSGKTTLTNAILLAIAELTPEDRILIFEDTQELQCSAPDRSFKLANENVDMRALLRASMRQMPDRIVVGEVRGAEAAVVLKAWNTGHEGGVLTLHANSAREGVEKFQEYVEEGLPGTDKKRSIATSVDLICYMPKRKKGVPPRLEEVVWLEGLQDGEYFFKTV